MHAWKPFERLHVMFTHLAGTKKAVDRVKLHREEIYIFYN